MKHNYIIRIFVSYCIIVSCCAQGACKFVTALLHYFFLATFTWTLCEAVLIYNLLVKVFGANDRKWLYIYLALGWGEQDFHAIMQLCRYSHKM